MNYHDTVPTTPGRYWTLYGIQHIASTTPPFNIQAEDYMLGPLPATQEEAISLACDVAFARMSKAAFKVDYSRRCEFLDAQWKYLHEVPSLELLRDIERVTGELTKTT